MEQFYRQSLEISRQIGDKAGEGGSLNSLGNVYRSLGEYAQAEQFYRQSLEISRQLGDKAGEGMALNNLGNVYYSLGEYAQAEQFYRQSLEISRQIGDKGGKATPQQPRKCLLFSGRVRPSGAILPPILRNIPATRRQSGGRHTLNNLGIVYSIWESTPKRSNSTANP